MTSGFPFDPKFPNRPSHPDFVLISQALIDQDKLAESSLMPMGEQLGQVVDPDSLTYAAKQRALRAAPTAPVSTQMSLAALWIDAFMCGARFQSLKREET